jgi:hypothetical protein
MTTAPRVRRKSPGRRSAAGLLAQPATASDLRGQLAAIVEHSNDAIFSRTFAGIITTWNSA